MDYIYYPQEYIDQNRVISTSTLRFWRQPSEEKLKASFRRIHENFYRTDDGLSRTYSISSRGAQPSEMRVLFDDRMQQTNTGAVVNIESRRPVLVPGYDKALSRYRNIISQSRHMSRRDKTLSLEYERECNDSNYSIGIRGSQSSNNMCGLMRSQSINRGLHLDNKCNYFSNQFQSPSMKKKFSVKEPCYSNLRPLNYVPPPPYDGRLASKPFMKMTQSKSLQQCNDIDYCHKAKYPVNNPHQKPPKPPPRSDSLIRSFEMICKNLAEPISEPRGESFKMFKSQRDYDNWLTNLPYNNRKKITDLLKTDSKATRRRCVSELLDDHMVGVEAGRRRRHSWPLITKTRTSFGKSGYRRVDSLPRVKKQIPVDKDFDQSLDSPSLRNYSRLYSLRHATKKSEKEHRDSASSDELFGRSSNMKKSTRYRYREMSSNINLEMTQSFHESTIFSVS